MQPRRSPGGQNPAQEAPRRPESSPGGARRPEIQKNSIKVSQGGAQGAARSHLSKAQKEAPRCSHSRSTPKMGLPCLRCRKRKFFSTPLVREAHFWLKVAQAAVRTSVFEHQKQRLWLQCGALSSKNGTLALEVSQKNFRCDTSSTRVVFLSQNAPHSSASHTFA